MAKPSLDLVEIEPSYHGDHRAFLLHFSGTKLTVTVTNKTEAVRRWIRNVRHQNRRFLRRRKFIVGLSLGVTGTGTVSTINLSAGRFCLIIQLQDLLNSRRRGTPPHILTSFFSSPKIKFVGISNQGHARDLKNSGIDIRNIYHLKDFYEENVSYREIVKRESKFEFDLDPKVTYSNWTKPNLDDDQISQAAADAYVRSKIGVKLSKDL